MFAHTFCLNAIFKNYNLIFKLFKIEFLKILFKIKIFFSLVTLYFPEQIVINCQRAILHKTEPRFKG